jgi:hypothetical protein
MGIYYEKQKDYHNRMKYYMIGAQANHHECICAINRNFCLISNIPIMISVYPYLSGLNKQVLNKIITDVINITDRNILDDTICITCRAPTKCVLLTCGHPICSKCFILPNRVCSHCGQI